MTMPAYDTRAACATQEKMRSGPLPYRVTPLPGAAARGIAKRLFLHVDKEGISPNPRHQEDLVRIRHCFPALALLLALSSPAAAQDFSKFSLDVPQGWTASTGEEGTVAVIAPKNEAAVTIAIEKLEDLSPEEVVRIFARELGAGEPQKTADGEYSFQYVRNGVSHRSIFRARKDHFLLITVSDETGKHRESIEGMLKSLKEK